MRFRCFATAIVPFVIGNLASATKLHVDSHSHAHSNTHLDADSLT